MPEDPAELRHFLSDRDAPCPGCGYNLRALTTDRCPECNQALELRVGLVEPRMGAFITGLVAIASGLGFCSLLTLYVLYWGLIRSVKGLPREFAVVVVGGIISLALLFIWLRVRRSIGRRSAGSRWALVSVVAALSLVAPAIFIATVR